MAEPKDIPSAVLGRPTPPDDVPRAESLFAVPTVVIQVATATGYGLWMVLGTSLAVGVYPDGRGEVLAPLAVGLFLVSLGLLATCLRLRFAPAWHGWNPVKRMMPTPEGMIAMANYLPMLALAGLARGGNDFWATRLAGAALMLCSLATLIYTARGTSRHFAGPVASVTNAWPVGRTVSALFAGGLWFWVCVSLQEESSAGPVNRWRLALLAVALALGVVEGMRWRALRLLADEKGVGQRLSSGRPAVVLLVRRFAAAVLSLGLPCLLLATHAAASVHMAMAGMAALSCVIGQCLEQRLYGRAYAYVTGG